MTPDDTRLGSGLPFGMHPPKLSHNATRDVYYLKFGGQKVYLAKGDRAKAEAAYADFLATTWVHERAKALHGPLAVGTLAALEKGYLAFVEAELGRERRKDYAVHLDRILRRTDRGGAIRDTWSPEMVTAQALYAIQTSMRSEYSARTINHSTKALARMLRWGHKQGIVSSLPDLRISGLRVPAPQPRAPEPSVVRALIAQAESADPRLAPWLALNYLSLMRPSEIVRLAKGEAEPLGDTGVWVMHGKTTARTGQGRHVLLTPEARRDWLPRLEPHWSHWRAYSTRTLAVLGPGGPRRLRAWGATHLRRAGVELALVRAALGHTERGAVTHYVETAWLPVVQAMEKLTLRA